MLVFTTPTELPIIAATTMGVSVKETDSAIGKFGTGLKYAIAGVLRLGGKIDILIENERYAFTVESADIRGKEFGIVHCNGSPCGFTTDLGKHWQPWQLFRELASNTLDEGGSWMSGGGGSFYPHNGGTSIFVACREVEESALRESVFIDKSRTKLIESRNGATVYEGASPHYYYNGIRAGSFGMTAPVTVDIHNGSLSEDRMLDLATVQLELSWAFRTATHCDESLLLSVIGASSPDDFWVAHLQHHAIASGELPPALMSFLLARPKFVRHAGFKKMLDKHQRRTGHGKWEPLPVSDHHAGLLAAGESVCHFLGVDPIPAEKARFTRDLDDECLAVTCMDTREVWFSTKLVMRGRDEFLAGYLEEAVHAMTGQQDCTRSMQNTLFALLVNTATRYAPASH